MTPHPDQSLPDLQEFLQHAREFGAMQARHVQAYPRKPRLRDTFRPMLLATTAFKLPILNS